MLRKQFPAPHQIGAESVCYLKHAVRRRGHLTAGGCDMPLARFTIQRGSPRD